MRNPHQSITEIKGFILSLSNFLFKQKIIRRLHSKKNPFIVHLKIQIGQLRNEFIPTTSIFFFVYFSSSSFKIEVNVNKIVREVILRNRTPQKRPDRMNSLWFYAGSSPPFSIDMLILHTHIEMVCKKRTAACTHRKKQE